MDRRGSTYYKSLDMKDSNVFHCSKIMLRGLIKNDTPSLRLIETKMPLLLDVKFLINISTLIFCYLFKS